MIRPVMPNVPLQELKILKMVLIFAEFLAKTDNSGRLKTTNAQSTAMLLGNKALKTESPTANSLANKDNGGMTKLRLVYLSAMLHGYKEQPTMSQLALNHAQLVSI